MGAEGSALERSGRSDRDQQRLGHVLDGAGVRRFWRVGVGRSCGLRLRRRWLYRNVSNTGGLTHIGARWYDPETGRWLQKDPALNGWNLYRYCANDPANLVDPSGEAPILAVFLIGAVVGVGVRLAFDYLDDGDLNDPIGDYVRDGLVGGTTGTVGKVFCGGVKVGQYFVRFDRYRRGGGGVNVYSSEGKWFMGADWHKWYDIGGKLHTGTKRLHIHLPGNIRRHWPWQ